MRELAGFFLGPALARASQLYYTQMNNMVQQFFLYHLTTSIALCFVLLILFLAYFRPLMANMDREVKRTRTMLLLFPDDVRSDCCMTLQGASSPT